MNSPMQGVGVSKAFVLIKGRYFKQGFKGVVLVCVKIVFVEQSLTIILFFQLNISKVKPKTKQT